MPIRRKVPTLKQKKARSLRAFSFTASSPSPPVSSRLYWKFNGRTAVATIVGKPMQGRNQFRRQLHAARINLKASLENLAAPGCHVQVSAGGLGVENSTPFILQFFKAAEATLIAKTVPVIVIVNGINHERRVNQAKERCQPINCSTAKSGVCSRSKGEKPARNRKIRSFWGGSACSHSWERRPAYDRHRSSCQKYSYPWKNRRCLSF